MKEYELDQIEKRAAGKGGIWRIPPSFDGNTRSPLPRFTALNPKEREVLREFFVLWARSVLPALRPGAHVFIASNAFISQLTFSALIEGGLEFRSEIIRLVRTLRGGDRLKNAEQEFPGVSSLPRGGYEPWGLFRKPMPSGMKVSDCLREFGTGGLRRRPDGGPFSDVIPSERTPKREAVVTCEWAYSTNSGSMASSEDHTPHDRGPTFMGRPWGRVAASVVLRLCMHKPGGSL
jgi:site-specific DNA-methyltransferase (adenine-specific)